MTTLIVCYGVTMLLPFIQKSSNAALSGRHKCDCLATKHKLISNCVKCGRIVCEQEGSGPCIFCGDLVSSPTILNLPTYMYLNMYFI